MINMRSTIIPKSDQLNADDLIGESMTIKITKVSASSMPEQPISINFEGDGGKPYKPCKSMRRVLVNVWGNDGHSYVGKSLTLYRDERILFGGVAVGGIRITHMSGIDKDVTMALTESKTRRKPFTVKPLHVSEAPAIPPELLAGAESAAKQGMDELLKFWGLLTAPQKLQLKPAMEGFKQAAAAVELPATEHELGE